MTPLGHLFLGEGLLLGGKSVAAWEPGDVMSQLDDSSDAFGSCVILNHEEQWDLGLVMKSR